MEETIQFFDIGIGLANLIFTSKTENLDAAKMIIKLFTSLDEK